MGRYRLSSIEPLEVDEALMAVVADAGDTVARHFHLPLQSGSDSVLRRMNRPYTAVEYLAVVGELARRFPDAAIGADVIAGFPGESEAEFEETVAFIEHAPLTYLHVFSYSDRPGTKASQMKPKVSPDTIHERSLRLRALGERKNASFRATLRGTEQRVLVLRERDTAGRLVGITGNYVEVLLDGEDELMNRFVRVRLEEAGEDGRWTVTLLHLEGSGAAAKPAAPEESDLMRALVQRVQRASVEVEGAIVGEIGPGLLLFVGVGKNDLDEDGGFTRARGLADKVANLRIFYDSEGKSNLSLLDTGGTALVISQFTLFADYRRGRRPSFSDAADPGPAEALVEEFRLALERLGVSTASGRFAAHMIVSLVNDGPYTILVDTDELESPRRGVHRAGHAPVAALATPDGGD